MTSSRLAWTRHLRHDVTVVDAVTMATHTSVRIRSSCFFVWRKHPTNFDFYIRVADGYFHFFFTHGLYQFFRGAVKWACPAQPKSSSGLTATAWLSLQGGPGGVTSQKLVRPSSLNESCLIYTLVWPIIFDAAPPIDANIHRSICRERCNEIPINHVGLVSFVFCTWLDPIMWRMFRHSDYDPLDSCQCPDLEKASANADR